MFDHLTLSVADFDKAKAFYEAALEPLGSRFILMLPPEHSGGVKVGALGPGRPQLWLAEDGPQSPPIHLAFTAADRDQVTAFYTAALAAGGTCNGPPGLRPHYHPDYFGAFVLDPDGNNIEAVCHTAPPH